MLSPHIALRMTVDLIISINKKKSSSSFYNIYFNLHKCIVSHNIRISIGSFASVIGIAEVYPNKEALIVLNIRRT